MIIGRGLIRRSRRGIDDIFDKEYMEILEAMFGVEDIEWEEILTEEEEQTEEMEPTFGVEDIEWEEVT